jgi:hypothetical protein
MYLINQFFRKIDIIMTYKENLLLLIQAWRL